MSRWRRPDTFSQYGLQRPAFLGDLKFAVVPGPRGAVIRITSSQPVMEPFVTLLLEVRWPQGRLLREYTVLLDPPAFTGGAVRQPVQAPTRRPRSRRPPRSRATRPAAAQAGRGRARRRAGQPAEPTRWRATRPCGALRTGIGPTGGRHQSGDAGHLSGQPRCVRRQHQSPERRRRAPHSGRTPSGPGPQRGDRRSAAPEQRVARDGTPRRAPARLELVPPPEAVHVRSAAAGGGCDRRPASCRPKSKKAAACLRSRTLNSRRCDSGLQNSRSRAGEVAVEPEPPAAAPAEPVAGGTARRSSRGRGSAGRSARGRTRRTCGYCGAGQAGSRPAPGGPWRQGGGVLGTSSAC